MKNKIFFNKGLLRAFAFFLGLLWLAAGSVQQAGATGTNEPVNSDQVQKEVSEAAEAIKKYAVSQRDEALVKARGYMDELDRRIERWQARLDAKRGQMSQAAREKWRESIKNLQKQRNDLSEWFGGMKHSSAGAWEEIKSGFSEAYLAVERSLENAEGKFREEK